MSLRGLLETWERRARTFHQRSSLLERGRLIRPLMVEAVRFLGDGQSLVADLGCGDGIPTEYLARRMPVLGIDFSMSMLRRAKSALREASFLNASMTKLPFKDGGLSAITCFFVVSDYREKAPLLSEISRVLQQNGRLVLADYSDRDEFNNLLDDIQVRVLGRRREMFRIDAKALAWELERAGMTVREAFELERPLRIHLTGFVEQLHLSSVGEKYREKGLSMNEWRKLLKGRLDGEVIRLTRRFVAVFAVGAPA